MNTTFASHQAAKLEENLKSVADEFVPVVKKNSEAWSTEKNILVLDPDGWDRTNYEESWAEEITAEEFNKRVIVSTCQYRETDKKNREAEICAPVKKGYDKFAREARTKKQFERLAMKINTYNGRVNFFNLDRNYRCPCGSGKKFKKCCIKHLDTSRKVLAKLQVAMVKIQKRARSL